MAVLEAEIAPKTMTYEDYLSEGVVYGRYEIINGVRHFMPNPTPLHQEIAWAIYELLRVWQRQTKLGRTFMAPRDVLVSLSPMRTRQPDVLFISNERIGASRFPNRPPSGRPRNWSWKSSRTAMRGRCVSRRYETSALLVSTSVG